MALRLPWKNRVRLSGTLLPKKYTLGPTLMELGKDVFKRMDFKKAARPVMESLMGQCGESVFLGVRNGNTVTVIDAVESRKGFKIFLPIGTSLPLLAGAVGKGFWAQKGLENARQYVKSPPIPLLTRSSI